jgi:RimJ/RimL family protein N-acetyltransferase
MQVERRPTEDGIEEAVGTGSQLRDRHVLLADGSLLELRRLTPSDQPGLRRFYAALSAATLHRRFMTPSPRLPDQMLSYLSEAGHLDREVVVATFGGRIVAEARYHRVPGSDDAEVAFVVADAWQGRGLGSALSELLARTAARRGVTAFTGSMLAENRAARRLLESAAPQADRWIRSGELEFRAPLPPDLGQAGGPSTTGSVSPLFRRNRRASLATRPGLSASGCGGGGSSLVRSDSTTA